VITKIYTNKRLQLGIGFAIGIGFGFALQRGGVTNFDVIVNQLLFKDFTVVKIMLSAMLTGMIGVHLLRKYGLAQLHPKPGSVGSTLVGGLIFGVGFGLLGYCPGTVVAAAAHGKLDALFGGILGMLAGAGIFAAWYPRLEKSVLNKGSFGERTLPEILNQCPWRVILVIELLVLGLFVWLEKAGL
jgi:uncharacterized membrane protein YedE/YeeE